MPLNEYLDKSESFDKSAFWVKNRDKLPIHYAVYLADCASKKAASANVETIFSGAKQLSDSATTMDDDVFGAYVFDHVNWQYEWLRPSVHDIVCAYLALHGEEAPVPVTTDASEQLQDEDEEALDRDAADGE